MSYVLQMIFAAYCLIDMFFKSVYQCFKNQGGLQDDPDYVAYAAENWVYTTLPRFCL